MAVAMEDWSSHPFPMPRLRSPFFPLIPPLAVALPAQAPQAPARQHLSPSHQHLTPTPVPPPATAPQQHNTRELTRDFLLTVLTYFSTLIPSHFDGLPVRLVVHGGACMLLHPTLYALAQQQHKLAAHSPSNSPHNALPRRTSTRDVDYIHRSFVSEWAALGIMDASERLQNCIKMTARKFQLGEDWMNSDADIALPMANDTHGKTYDPIYEASIKPNNINAHTIFSSPDGILTLISVTPFWAVALKLVRYTKFDPGDICLLLRNGTNMSNVIWTPETLERWIVEECWPMGYANYDVMRRSEMRYRIKHAVDMVSGWSPDEGGPVIPGQTPLKSSPNGGRWASPAIPTPGQSQPNTGRRSSQAQSPVFIPQLPKQQQQQQQPNFQSQHHLSHQANFSWTSAPQIPMPVPNVPVLTPVIPGVTQPGADIIKPRRQRPAEHDSPTHELDLDDPKLYPLPRHPRTRDRDRRPNASQQHQRHVSQPGTWHGYQISAAGSHQQQTQERLGASPSPNPNPNGAVYYVPDRVPAFIPPRHGGVVSPVHGRMSPSHAGFERSVGQVLDEGRRREQQEQQPHEQGSPWVVVPGPSVVIPEMMLASVNLNVESERRNKEKHRAKDRKKDRIRKFWNRYRVGGDEGGGGGEDSTEEEEGEEDNFEWTGGGRGRNWDDRRYRGDRYREWRDREREEEEAGRVSTTGGVVGTTWHEHHADHSLVPRLRPTATHMMTPYHHPNHLRDRSISRDQNQDPALDDRRRMNRSRMGEQSPPPGDRGYDGRTRDDDDERGRSWGRYGPTPPPVLSPLQIESLRLF